MNALETLDLDRLRELVDDAHLLASTPTDELNAEETAGLALELAAINTIVVNALEPLKVKLRELAREGLKTPHGKITLHGELEYETTEGTRTHAGDVTVTFPTPSPRLAKTADLPALKAGLGDRFDRYFTTEVKYKPVKELPDLVQSGFGRGLPMRELELVMGAVEYTDPTPRVGFKPSHASLSTTLTREDSP